jgi:phospholipid transport system substrate-binding protein
MHFPLRFSVAAAAFALVAPAVAQAADPAAAPVQTLDDGLLSIMKGGAALGTQGRAAKIGPVVDQSYDIGLITRLSVGTSWTTIAPADQTALVAAMRRLTVAQYAANFDSFGGESFTIDPKVETRGGDKLVRTTLNQPKDGPVSIGYRLRESGGRWKIIDVYYKNAISQLATRRSDFAGVLAKGGAKALIAHLDQLATKAAH